MVPSSFIYKSKHPRVAQLVRARDLQSRDAGSNPDTRTTFIFLKGETIMQNTCTVKVEAPYSVEYARRCALRRATSESPELDYDFMNEVNNFFIDSLK